MAIILQHLHQPARKVKTFKSVIQLVPNQLDQLPLEIPGRPDLDPPEIHGQNLTRPRPDLSTPHRQYLGSPRSPIHGTVMMAMQVVVSHSRNKFTTSTKILDPVEKLFMLLSWQNLWKINSFFRMFFKTKKF